MGVAYSRNKLALRTMLRNFNLKSQFSIFDSLRDIHIYDFLKFVGSLWPLKWTWQTFFSSIKTVGATVFGQPKLPNEHQ